MIAPRSKTHRRYLVAIGVLAVASGLALVALLIVLTLRGMSTTSTPVEIGDGSQAIAANGDTTAVQTQDDLRALVEQTRSILSVPARDGNRPAYTGDGTLRIAVVAEHDRRIPIEAATVIAIPFAASSYLANGLRRTTDANGTVQFESVQHGDWMVCVAGGDFRRTSVFPGATTEHVIPLPIGATVTGVVLDPMGSPVAHADLWGVISEVYRSDIPLGVSDAKGRFSVRLHGVVTELAASAQGFGPSLPVDTLGTAGDLSEVAIHLTAGGASLSGTILGDNGCPLSGAFVVVEGDPEFLLSPNAPSPSVVYSGERRPTFFCRTNGSGRFGVDLPPGRTTVAVSADARGIHVEEVTLNPGQQLEVTIRLPEEVLLFGFVSDLDGRPAGGATIRMEEGGALLGVDVISAIDGTFLVAGLPMAKEFTIVVDGADRGSARRCFSAESTITPRIEWNPVLGRTDQLRGCVFSDVEIPLSGTSIALIPEVPAFGERRYALANEAGEFVFEDCVVGSYDLTIAFPWLNDAEVFRVEGVWPGSGIAEIHLDARAIPSSQIRCQVLDEAGMPRSDALVTVEHFVHRPAHPVPLYVADGMSLPGCFESPLLCPDSYWLRASLPGCPRIEVGPIEIAVDEVVDVGPILVEQGHLIGVRFDPSPEDRGSLLFYVLAENGRLWLHREGTVSAEGALVELGSLQPGCYTLLLRRTNRASELARRVFQVMDGPIEIRFGVDELRTD